jgi:hypothetical protein
MQDMKIVIKSTTSYADFVLLVILEFIHEVRLSSHSSCNIAY